MISELIPLERLTDHTAPSQYPPPRPEIEMDTPSQPLGKLAQGLSLTMTPTNTASPLWKLSPQSPGFCANILGFFGGGGGGRGGVLKNSARYTLLILRDGR